MGLREDVANFAKWQAELAAQRRMGSNPRPNPFALQKYQDPTSGPNSLTRTGGPNPSPEASPGGALMRRPGMELLPPTSAPTGAIPAAKGLSGMQKLLQAIKGGTRTAGRMGAITAIPALAYAVAREYIPENSLSAFGPLGAFDQAQKAFTAGDRSLPDLPEGPGLPINSLQRPNAEKILKTPMARSGGKGLGRGFARPRPQLPGMEEFDLSALGGDMGLPTVPNYEEDLGSKLSGLGMQLPQGNVMDDKNFQAPAKNRNPLLRAIMALGKGLGKVF